MLQWMLSTGGSSSMTPKYPLCGWGEPLYHAQVLSMYRGTDTGYANNASALLTGDTNRTYWKCSANENDFNFSQNAKAETFIDPDDQTLVYSPPYIRCLSQAWDWDTGDIYLSGLNMEGITSSTLSTFIPNLVILKGNVKESSIIFRIWKEYEAINTSNGNTARSHQLYLTDDKQLLWTHGEYTYKLTQTGYETLSEEDAAPLLRTSDGMYYYKIENGILYRGDNDVWEATPITGLSQYHSVWAENGGAVVSAYSPQAPQYISTNYAKPYYWSNNGFETWQQASSAFFWVSGANSAGMSGIYLKSSTQPTATANHRYDYASNTPTTLGGYTHGATDMTTYKWYANQPRKKNGVPFRAFIAGRPGIEAGSNQRRFYVYHAPCLASAQDKAPSVGYYPLMYNTAHLNMCFYPTEILFWRFV